MTSLDVHPSRRPPTGDILLFGGTFDPPQRAHIELPFAVARLLRCERVLFIPTSINPLKSGQQPASPADRLAMLRLALGERLEAKPGAGRITAEIDTLELDRPPPAYTFDTLVTLRSRLGPAQRFRLLMGSDSAKAFPLWRNPAGILSIATPAVVIRPPDTRASLERDLRTMHAPLAADTWIRSIVDVPPVDVSSTEVRRRLRTGAPVDDLLTPTVAAYIAEHGLFR